MSHMPKNHKTGQAAALASSRRIVVAVVMINTLDCSNVTLVLTSLASMVSPRTMSLFSVQLLLSLPYCCTQITTRYIYVQGFSQYCIQIPSLEKSKEPYNQVMLRQELATPSPSCLQFYIKMYSSDQLFIIKNHTASLTYVKKQHS